MASWSEIEAAEGEFARLARERLEAHAHLTLATLRADGAPRISGIECFFTGGDLWFGSMPNAVKALDLRRDPRFALHSGSVDPPEWEGDAKLNGRAEEITDPERRLAMFGPRGTDTAPSGAHLFRCELDDVALVGLNEARNRLVIQHWAEDRGLRRIERE